MVKKIPHGDPGVASFASDAYAQVTLFMSNTPAAVSTPIAVAAATATATLPIYSVVGVNVTGEIVPAEHGVTNAIGFTASAITDGTAKAAIFRAGHVNVNALDWPASFDTDAKKLTAFEGAPSPTNIVADQNPNDPTFTT